jgi:hypothetical protein
MAYVINKFDGTPLVVLEDGTLNTSTSLGLLGRNYVGYGEIQNENFVHLLENFANLSPPPTPIPGQTWYNSTTQNLNVFNGLTWIPVTSTVVSSTEPTATAGTLWYNTVSNQLFVYNVDKWDLVGPESLANFGKTRLVSETIIDASDNVRPVIKALIDDETIAIISKDVFTIGPTNLIPNFLNIQPGINLASNKTLSGSVNGNAATASKLVTARTINGVTFDGSQNIEINANSANLLKPGSYITGSNFDGSAEVQWSIDASSANLADKIVARDSSGNFAANVITANISGNVTTTTGTSKFNRIEANEFVGATLSGNSFSATQLQTARRINGISFNGTQDITVSAAALTLTGTKLSPTVVESSLTSLGILSSLKTQNAGITIGGNNDIRLRVDTNQTSTLLIDNAQGLLISLADSKQVGNRADFQFITSDMSTSMGGPQAPAFIGDVNSKTNLGLPSKTFSNIYSDNFIGIASSARYADLAENYVADGVYEAGTVLEFGGTYEVTLASESSQRVAGIVSSKPAYLMNSDCNGTHVVPLALQGRVPCKVKGTVKKGDILISAGDGFARACNNPLIGTVIGKSLEDFDGFEGVIEVAVGRL